ncbi:pimeloyl-ACP methyl ester carboxylesterase [Winogradskyella wandonensis]|uniref:Pimeloyl-ACP methyl ester carboxylesterase n=1 Tax=Winogradskyella wandonensis TaxID=1442586 RepID=A0A4R1KS37_9FLAO|nr:alpha/beta hydrolase [Winogradskyella wandonensis]TCK67844.1 pimeloyl-ACP methyl ester carboxylesterase [Winogradskyella wandonensis]
MKNITLAIISLLFFFITEAQETPKPIHVEVIGQGQPILLIPGFTVPGDSWTNTVNRLKKDYECHIVTLAGFGGKPPIKFPWLPKINEALEDYITSNKLENLLIIGHNLGGTVAIWLASRESLNLSKLILVDALPAAGALMFPNFNPNNLAYDSPFNNQQLAMSKDDFSKLADGMSKGMSLNPKDQEQIKHWILETDRKTYVYGYTDYLKLDVREHLKSIKIPVTILAAEQPFGKDTALENYKSQYANLKAYDLIVAENSAHFIMFDQPEWFLQHINKSLSLTK